MPIRLSQPGVWILMDRFAIVVADDRGVIRKLGGCGRTRTYMSKGNGFTGRGANQLLNTSMFLFTGAGCRIRTDADRSLLLTRQVQSTTMRTQQKYFVRAAGLEPAYSCFQNKSTSTCHHALSKYFQNKLGAGERARTSTIFRPLTSKDSVATITPLPHIRGCAGWI